MVGGLLLRSPAMETEVVSFLREGPCIGGRPLFVQNKVALESPSRHHCVRHAPAGNPEGFRDAPTDSA